MRQAIILTDAYPVHRRIYTGLVEDEMNSIHIGSHSTVLYY